MATYPLKKYRLNRKEFKEVLGKGRTFKIGSLILKVLFKEKGKKFGFLISKRILKKATQRNKIKRRLREILRETVDNLKDGIRAVFIASHGLEKKEFLELKEIFKQLIKRAQLIKDESSY